MTTAKNLQLNNTEAFQPSRELTQGHFTVQATAQTGSKHYTHFDLFFLESQTTAPPSLRSTVTGIMKGSSSCSACTPGHWETRNIQYQHLPTESEDMLVTILTLSPQSCLSSSGKTNSHVRYLTSEQTQTQPLRKERGDQQSLALFYRLSRGGSLSLSSYR